MNFCRIPAGEFLLGSDDGNDDERPLRKARTGAYEIGETPVTNGDYAPFLSAYLERRFWSDAGWEWRARENLVKPRFWDDPAWQAYLAPEQPIVGVSFYEAEAFARFCEARLPGEHEWERAARGEDGRRYPWGNSWEPARAAFRGGLRHTLPVKSHPENISPHGLYDCAGNVWEWCADQYAQGLRSARGGSWNAHPPQLRCSARNAWPPEARFSNLGFRIAR
jgi:formylglycine-generating enzyme required for sulfatase activity